MLTCLFLLLPLPPMPADSPMLPPLMAIVPDAKLSAPDRAAVEYTRKAGGFASVHAVAIDTRAVVAGKPAAITLPGGAVVRLLQRREIRPYMGRWQEHIWRTSDGVVGLVFDGDVFILSVFRHKGQTWAIGRHCEGVLMIGSNPE